MFQDEIYAPRSDKYFIATLPVPTQYENNISLEYLDGINTDYDTGIIYCSDPRAFIDKTWRKSNTENPSYDKAMIGPHAREYKIAIHK